MTCDEMRELLPGYALDALDLAETTDIELHLRDCREHDDELVGLRATGFALSLLDEEREPSAILRGRVLAVAARSTPAAPHASSGTL